MSNTDTDKKKLLATEFFKKMEAAMLEFKQAYANDSKARTEDEWWDEFLEEDE